MYTKAIIDSFGQFILVVFAAGFALAVGLFFGLPWLWSIIKPWLHAITG